MARPFRPTDLLARAVVSILFLLFSIHLLGEFLRTYHVTGLLLLVSEALIVPLMVLRRRTDIVDRSALAAAVTAVSVAGSPLLRTLSEGSGPLPDWATALMSSVGLALVIAGKVTLGRSFGIIPANRGVVARGPYVLMRHPIYTGYLITHIAFAIAHPTAWNMGVLLVADSALIVRALLEERVLCGDETYRTYCGRVGWHLVPGVF